jgi:Skp family chaperone for outer membrane proteins
MKRIAIALLVLLSMALSAAAQTQQITNVGVIDFTKVLLTAYKDTRGYRDYDLARTQYNQELAARTKDITDLQSQKIDADKAGNKAQSLQLEKSISDRQADLDNYKRIKGSVLQQQLSGLLTGQVLKEIMEVVTLVAESGGYSLILRIDTGYRDIFLYNIPEIDVTNDVVKIIVDRQGKSSG